MLRNRVGNPFVSNFNIHAAAMARKANPLLQAPQVRMTAQPGAAPPQLPAVQKARTPMRRRRRSIGAPRTKAAAPGSQGEVCWWTGDPHDAYCCIYDGIAFPFCVTYPDVDE